MPIVAMTRTTMQPQVEPIEAAAALGRRGRGAVGVGTARAPSRPRNQPTTPASSSARAGATRASWRRPRRRRLGRDGEHGGRRRILGGPGRSSDVGRKPRRVGLGSAVDGRALGLGRGRGGGQIVGQAAPARSIGAATKAQDHERAIERRRCAATPSSAGSPRPIPSQSMTPGLSVYNVVNTTYMFRKIVTRRST